VHEHAPPTVRQIYALAAALCERTGEEFPQTRGQASELIERLRSENGHPAPRLEDGPPLQQPRRRFRRHHRPKPDLSSSAIADELGREGH